MPFYKRGVISKNGRETFFFISKIIHLHYNHSYFKGLLLVQFFSLFLGFFRTVREREGGCINGIEERFSRLNWVNSWREGGSKHQKNVVTLFMDGHLALTQNLLWSDSFLSSKSQN